MAVNEFSSFYKSFPDTVFRFSLVWTHVYTKALLSYWDPLWSSTENCVVCLMVTSHNSIFLILSLLLKIKNSKYKFKFSKHKIWTLDVFLGLCLRAVSVKSHCHTPTLRVLQGVGTVVLTHPIRRAVFRHSEPEGRIQEAMATPPRTDLMGINLLTCQRVMVSYTIWGFIE